MYSIYQFGFKVYEDTEKWQKQINNLFEVDFEIKEIINTYTNIEKNWIESILPSLCQLENFELFEEKVERVHASFNRYQSYVYLTLVFEEDVTKKYDFIKKLQAKLKDNVNGFIDNFQIPFKEPESEVEKAKYAEVLSIENPVLVTENFNNNTYIKTTIKSGSVFYKFEYMLQNKSQYSRIFKQVYISENSSKEILEHFHSIFVLFHRSYEFYKELINMDDIRLILFEMSDAFNRIWPTERMRLFMLHRIWNANLFNKTFFSILELTAQMDTLINQLVVKNQKIFDKYEKQYERVFHNFDIDNLESDKIYVELMHYLKAPYNYRKHSIDNIRSLYEPTDEQICRLRSDNDSRVNFAIQSIMSILTVVFFIWGVLSVWYQTTIDFTSTISDKVLFNSHYWPATFSMIAIGTALTSIAIAIIVSSRNSRTFNNEVRNVIESQELNLDIIRLKVKKIKSCEIKKNRLLLITELFNIITAFLTINSNYNRLEYFKNEILNAIKEVDNC